MRKTTNAVKSREPGRKGEREEERAKFRVLQQTDSIRLPAKFRLDRFILSSSGGENPQFLLFFGLRHLVMSPIVINLRKLSMGAQVGRTNSDVQKRDEQTDKQTKKNSTFLATRRRVKSITP